MLDAGKEDGAVGGGIAGRKTARRGGWSGGTVRLVDALAPALRCSRDFGGSTDQNMSCILGKHAFFYGTWFFIFLVDGT
jgi:hypothetical protein